MPQLVEEFDNMRLCIDAAKRTGLQVELEQKCWEHDQQLLAWLGMLSRIANPSKQPSREPRAEDITIRIAQVHGMSLYWTTSLVLYSILRSVAGTGTDLPARTDPVHHARNLTASLGTLLQPKAGLFGQQSVVLLLEIALQYTMDISTASSEGGVLVETLKRLKDDSVNGPARVLEAHSDHHQGAVSEK